MSTMMWVAVCIFAIGFVIIAVLGILGTNDVINYHNEQYRKEREQKWNYVKDQIATPM